jgi:hypothetical protein
MEASVHFSENFETSLKFKMVVFVVGSNAGREKK